MPTPTNPLSDAAFTHAPVALLVAGAEGRVVLANARACELLGYAHERLVGMPVEALLPATVRAHHVRQRAAFADAPGPRTLADGRDLEVLRADGTAVGVDVAIAPLEGGMVCVALGDATEHRRSARRLRDLANTDELTGLLNRRGLEQALSGRLGARRTGDRFALLTIDVDHFKDINDTAGHLTGDDLLRAIALAMSARLRAEDVLARVGGDEFVVCLAGIDEPRARAVGEDLRATIATLTVPDESGAPIGTTISLGLAAHPADGPTLRDLLSAADTRLYAVKVAGRDAVG